MTISSAGPAAPTVLDRAGRRRVLTTLCVTQLTGWGVLFYAFPVMQSGIAADTGWSLPRLTAAFTAGQVLAAVLGLPLGRLLDRRGPHLLMTGGSLLAALSLVAVALASSLTGFAVAWLLAGASMSAVLYSPAFAALTRWFPGRSRLRALTVLTVAGGLASTVFAPLTAVLHEQVGWRSTYLLLAGLLAVVTVPLHAWGLRGPWAGARPVRPPARAAGGARHDGFVLLAVVFALASLTTSAGLVGLVPLLREHGIGLETAGLVLAVGGVGQVVGRIGYGVVADRVEPGLRLAILLLVVAGTTTVFALVPVVAVLAATSFAAGAMRGSLTLVRATAVTERWGAESYAELSGRLSLPAGLAGAGAPWFGAVLADLTGGYDTAFLVLAAAMLVTAGLARATRSVPG